MTVTIYDRGTSLQSGNPTKKKKTGVLRHLNKQDSLELNIETHTQTAQAMPNKIRKNKHASLLTGLRGRPSRDVPMKKNIHGRPSQKPMSEHKAKMETPILDQSKRKDWRPIIDQSKSRDWRPIIDQSERSKNEWSGTLQK
jgi:hypothetical protein